METYGVSENAIFMPGRTRPAVQRVAGVLGDVGDARRRAALPRLAPVLPAGLPARDRLPAEVRLQRHPGLHDPGGRADRGPALRGRRHPELLLDGLPARPRSSTSTCGRARTGRTRSTPARECRRRASEAPWRRERRRQRGSPSPIEQSRAVPIGDYGFLSDGEVSALVAPARLGRLDVRAALRRARASFGAVLGRRAGSFRLAPLDARVPAARRYLPGTMILETSWGTTTGWMIVRDVLLIGPWHHAATAPHTYRRTPNDYEAEHVLLRTDPLRLGRGADDHGLRAGPRLRPRPRPVGVHRRQLPPGPGHAPRGRRRS